MAFSDIQILEGQLKEHLGVPGRRVRFVAQTTGFTLQIAHSDLRLTLFTQRGSPRVFKNLTLAAAFLKDREVKCFRVVLEQQSSAKKGPKAETVGKKKPKRKPFGQRAFPPDEE